MKRRNILIGLGTVAVGAAAGGAYWLQGSKGPMPGASDTAANGGGTTLATPSAGMPLYDDDPILGDANAPVTILEFSSLTCPHCASFHRDTLPQVKANWIDSGKARLVYRHYPLDQLALRAAAAANCITGDGFFGFIDVLFSSQETWAHSQDPLRALGQLSAMAGLSPEAFAACVNDEAAIDRILQKQSEGRDTYKVASTPSFVVNGTAVVGARDYDEFNGFLESAAAASS